MKRLHVKFIKWLSNKFGYKIIMLKAANGTTTIEGDKELLKYVDVSGYFFKKEPLSRIKASKTPTSAEEMFLSKPVPDITHIDPVVKLTSKHLKDLGIIK
jgi:hypothetical protein